MMMRTVSPPELCTGCRACEAICHNKALVFEDKLDAVYVEINQEQCIQCGLCKNVCPIIKHVKRKAPQEWYQGWANDESIRNTSASGGIAAALSYGFIKSGGYVCSCCFDSGKFVYKTTDNIEDIKSFSGSKYVKTNPYSIYQSVDELLRNGEKVLFIGLPCHVAAIKNFISERIQCNLYCIDLICHGTPSEKMLKEYLKQHNIVMNNIKKLCFREKTKYRIEVDSVSQSKAIDRYSISFLNALNFTEGCYNCQFAAIERISDISLGDNWGTELIEELPKGISLILCMTEKGKELLKMSEVTLLEVDKEKAISTNGQLVHPSCKPTARESFFCGIKQGANYDHIVFRLLPKQCLRQFAKELAIKLKFIKDI